MRIPCACDHISSRDHLPASYCHEPDGKSYWIDVLMLYIDESFYYFLLCFFLPIQSNLFLHASIIKVFAFLVAQETKAEKLIN